MIKKKISNKKATTEIADLPKPPKISPEKMREYRNGGEGMTQWVEDNVYMPVPSPGSSIAKWCPMNNLPDDIFPETGRSYKSMWENQKKVLHEALRMEDGKFVHRLIVLCWMRGEGKTAIGPVLINLWKFFCFPRQKIALCANSANQTKFITFDMARDIVLNSPNLLVHCGGKHNIVNNSIRLLDKNNKVASQIICVTSFTGILSGITGYAFSEVFQMVKPEFFSQIDQSTRNVPNALGVIDSTVSAKDHFLRTLYDTFLAGEDPYLFFSYRCSSAGDHKDFWHPLQTQDQLNSFRAKSMLNSFGRYLLNLWTAGSDRLIDDECTEAAYYLGDRSDLMNAELLKSSLGKIESLKLQLGQTTRHSIRENLLLQIRTIQDRLVPVDQKYKLESYGDTCYADPSVLKELGDFYDTDWAILVGLDRSDPGRIEGNSRTILVAVAKGMIGSRDRKDLMFQSTSNYFYLLLYLANLTGNSLEEIKISLNFINGYYGVDMFTAEKYGLWDLTTWAEEYGVPLTIITPSKPMQAAFFGEFQQIFRTCRFKTPNVPVPGTNADDIFKEELQHFKAEIVSDKDCKFGSDEKKKADGAQDDSMYATAEAIYGGRLITVDQFHSHLGKISFGSSHEQKGLLGNYGD